MGTAVAAVPTPKRLLLLPPHYTTLPNTGANSNVIFALAVILIALGASTLVKNRQNN